MTPFQQVGFAVCILLTVCSLVVVLWLSFVVAELRQMVETHEDKLTPSFVEEHKKTIRAPQPDIKQASRVPPPGAETKQFTGSNGAVHTFQFGGESR